MQCPSSLQTKEKFWVDWCLWDQRMGQRIFLQGTTNLLYHCFIESPQQLSSKHEHGWKIHSTNYGWWQILKHSWHSRLPLVESVDLGCHFGITSKTSWTSYRQLFLLHCQSAR